MIKIPETKELFEEKTMLLIKLDKAENYSDEAEKEKDELRVGEIEKQIRSIVYSKIEQFKSDVPVKHTQKVTDMKTARKILNKKYGDYKDLTTNARELVDDLVSKKKEGRELLEKVVALKGKYDKDVVDGILRY